MHSSLFCFVQTIPESKLPIRRVQDDFEGLLGTSSMVFPKLPECMSKAAKIIMTITDPLDDNTMVNVMTRTDKRWNVGKFEMSTSETLEVRVNKHTKQ
jgi:hypothetical protein